MVCGWEGRTRSRGKQGRISHPFHPFRVHIMICIRCPSESPAAPGRLQPLLPHPRGGCTSLDASHSSAADFASSPARPLAVFVCATELLHGWLAITGASRESLVHQSIHHAPTHRQPSLPVCARIIACPPSIMCVAPLSLSLSVVAHAQPRTAP